MNRSADVVIVGAARTPQGRLMGQLAPLSAVELGGAAIAGAVEKAKIRPDAVEAVIMGHVLQAGPDRILPGRPPSQEASRLAPTQPPSTRSASPG